MAWGCRTLPVVVTGAGQRAFVYLMLYPGVEKGQEDRFSSWREVTMKVYHCGLGGPWEQICQALTPSPPALINYPMVGSLLWGSLLIHKTRKARSALASSCLAPSLACLSAGPQAKEVGAGEGCRAACTAELGTPGTVAPGKGALMISWVGSRGAQGV